MVSVVLSDWSCRESFHILKLLEDQSVPREQYEVIWIEYYGRQAPEIREMLTESQKAGKPPVVDQWIVMDVPENTYYHKHLMFNAGILASRGEIVVICDSDAIVKPTFVESILNVFKSERNIVLHLDEIRNAKRQYYPFKYPSITELTRNGCINFLHGKTTGLWDQEDPLHTRNYGACLCALRADLIAIGGADEHLDYLGHICGPYEMTFRLINSGKKEVWHQTEFLYHAWHPGSDGHKNYLGPHDGRNLSTTALKARKTQRVLPLVENRAVRALRLKEQGGVSDDWKTKLFPEAGLASWSRENADRIGKKTPLPPKRFSLKRFWIEVRIGVLLLFMTLRQILFKAKVQHENRILQKNFAVKFRLAFAYIRRMWRNNLYAVRRCVQTFLNLKTECVEDASLYGKGDIAKILKIVAERFLFKIALITDSAEDLRDYKGAVVIASFVGLPQKAAQLKNAGVPDGNIVKLQ